MSSLFRVDRLIEDISDRININTIKSKIRDNILSKQTDIYNKVLRPYEVTFKTIKAAEQYKKYKLKKYGHTKRLYDEDYWWNNLHMEKKISNNRITLLFTLAKDYLFYYNSNNFKTKYGKQRTRKWLGVKLIKKIILGGSK